VPRLRSAAVSNAGRPFLPGNPGRDSNENARPFSDGSGQQSPEPATRLRSSAEERERRGMCVAGIHPTRMHTYTDPGDVLPLELCRFRRGYRRGVKRDAARAQWRRGARDAKWAPRFPYVGTNLRKVQKHRNDTYVRATIPSSCRL